MFGQLISLSAHPRGQNCSTLATWLRHAPLQYLDIPFSSHVHHLVSLSHLRGLQTYAGPDYAEYSQPHDPNLVTRSSSVSWEEVSHAVRSETDHGNEQVDRELADAVQQGKVPALLPWHMFVTERSFDGGLNSREAFFKAVWAQHMQQVSPAGKSV